MVVARHFTQEEAACQAISSNLYYANLRNNATAITVSQSGCLNIAYIENLRCFAYSHIGSETYAYF